MICNSILRHYLGHRTLQEYTDIQDFAECQLTVKRMKYFWLFSPMQLLTHGQWWSIFRIQRRQTLQYKINHLYACTGMWVCIHAYNYFFDTGKLLKQKIIFLAQWVSTSDGLLTRLRPIPASGTRYSPILTGSVGIRYRLVLSRYQHWYHKHKRYFLCWLVKLQRWSNTSLD